MTPNSRSYLNHFTQPDSIVSDPYNSQDWDRYSYAHNNPIRNNDPSGHCTGKADNTKNPDYDCWQKVAQIMAKYKNIQIDGSRWTLDELITLEEGLNDIDSNVGMEEGGEFEIQRRHFDLTYLIHWLSGEKPLGAYDPITKTLTLYDGAFVDEFLAKLTTYHEFGHVVEHEQPEGFQEFANEFWKGCPLNSQCSTSGIPASSTPIEDFPETFAIVLSLNVNQGDIKPIATYAIIPDTNRINFMNDYISQLQNRK